MLTTGAHKELRVSLSNSLPLCAEESIVTAVLWADWESRHPPSGSRKIPCSDASQAASLLVSDFRGTEGSAHSETPLDVLTGAISRKDHSCFILFFFLRVWNSLWAKVHLGSKSLIFSLHDGNESHERRKIVCVKYKNKFKFHVKKTYMWLINECISVCFSSSQIKI